MLSQTVIGVDFSSSPSRKKPIVLAQGTSPRQGVVQLDYLQVFDTLGEFSGWLNQAGTWLGAFDFPFGLPRELVQTLEWPTSWAQCIQHYRQLSRAEIRDTFATFCNARPAGQKFAHRACDQPAGSSPSMKWVNPPVAYMLHAGGPLLRDAGVSIPGLQEGDPNRVALEGYPGLLARELLDKRSYKSDDKSKQTTERLIARKDLINALELGQTRLELRLRLSHAQREALAADGTGDRLDAVLCMVQAAWARWQKNWGLPEDFDPLEGWIVTTPINPPPKD
jgi:hypothetical protein